MSPTTLDDDRSIRPFRIDIPTAELEDLRRRLGRTRWAGEETVPDWSQGVRTADLRALVAYWRDAYDWRRFESEMNRRPQFLTRIDGVDIRFLHVRSPHPTALPILLTHGWPGSAADYLGLIEPLTDPTTVGGDAADAFDVVIPTLPGFGFSGAPTTSGWNAKRIARAWVELMRRLGYDHWTAQGGDWGGVVTTALGAMRPKGLRGIHLHTPYAFPTTIPPTLSPDEQHALDGLARYGGELGGSNHLQSTRPQTVAAALADSPAGQAAWIYEKYQSKTDNSGRAEDAIPLDTILDGISVSWFTNSAASSARIYWENRSATMAGPTLSLPTAVTVFPADIPRLPRSWIADTYPDLIHYGEAAHGGHFAALEQPSILAAEIREGLRTLR